MHSDVEPGNNGSNYGPNFKVNIARDVLFALEGTGTPAKIPRLPPSVPISTFRLFFAILH